MTVPAEDWTPWELMLLILCFVLGTLLLGALIGILVLLLRVKGKYGGCGAPGAVGRPRPGVQPPGGGGGPQRE